MDDRAGRPYIYFPLIFLICLMLFSGKPKENKIFKPLTNDDYNFIAANEILMYVSNNGDGSHDPATGGNGFYWPGGKLAKKAAIFEDGLLWGGKVNGEIRVNGSTHRHGSQAGKILSSGVADNPDDPRFRVYKIRKEWESLSPGTERDAYDRDYNEWPVEDGAPWVDVDGDGIFTRGIDQPEFIGDEVLWYVSNDLDSSRSLHTYGSNPIGLESQTLVWGFNKKNFLGDVVFKKYTLINKSTTLIDSMYLAYWTDDDLGDASDDYVGCDTLLNLGYSYNGDNTDGDGSGIQYGTPPPAVGHLFVQGPVIPGEPSDSAKYDRKWLPGYKNLPLTSFMIYIGGSARYLDPQQGTYIGTLQFYNNMKSLLWNGNPIIDPNTGLVSKFIVPGNPVAGEGWYEGPGWPGGSDPDDRRFLMSTGPFSMAPGDTQEVVIAIFIALGEDNIDSITELKKASRSVQIAYDLDFRTTPTMDKPILSTVRHDQSLTLYWESNTESFESTDPLLTIKGLQGVNDTTYSFEGYRIWQFRDIEGSDPRVIFTYDKRNDVDIIYEWKTIDGFPAYVVGVNGPNEGIRRSQLITKSTYDDNLLNNANPYYFAVTAYAYSEHSDPAYIESEPEIVEVIPGLKSIDENIVYDREDIILADHNEGVGDGSVELIVMDPYALTGNEYSVIFKGEGRDASYSFINSTSNDTIIADCTDFMIDTVGAKIIDGFILRIDNQGLREIQKLEGYWEKYAVRDILEVTGPGGIKLSEPIDVIENSNSTGDWQIFSYGFRNNSVKQNIDVNDQVGYQNYEIRFTETGSEYYLTGGIPGFLPWRADDPKAADRVPIEIWDVGVTESDSDDFRLAVKTLDDYYTLQEDSIRVDQDGKWSQLENGDWEPIFAFFQDSIYQEPLPETSGQINRPAEESRFGRIVIKGELPVGGTVIRITTWKPLSAEDEFTMIAEAPKSKDYASAKTNLDDISVFPNPFFGFGTMSGYLKQDFMRFTNVPTEVKIRIFSLAGVYVRQIEKNDDNPWLDWDLKNNVGEQVASGVYIAHLEMPNIGEKIMKLAIILENQR